MSANLRTREHLRMVERIVALAEAYGATELVALRGDLEVVLRIEYLAHERRVKSARQAAFRERERTRSTKSPHPG